MGQEKTRKALIIVDVQNDFCPGGALVVPKGDEVVPVIANLLRKFYFITTQDWHPDNHCSFVENGGRWPKHCVQNTEGADLHPDLAANISYDHALRHFHICKGYEPDEDAYSGFKGNINLVFYLNDLGIEQVYVCGLATDYCVKETALDSQEAGFETFVVIDACRGVNMKKGDVGRAVKKMRRAGIKIVSSKELL